MIRSPSSASAISSARSRSGGIAIASTSVSASASTSDGPPDNCASSPMNDPGLWVTIGVRRPDWSRWLISTSPERNMVRPWPVSPTMRQRLARFDNGAALPNRRSRSTSAAAERRETSAPRAWR